MFSSDLRIHAPELLINDGLPHTHTGGMGSPILLLQMNLAYFAAPYVSSLHPLCFSFSPIFRGEKKNSKSPRKLGLSKLNKILRRCLPLLASTFLGRCNVLVAAQARCGVARMSGTGLTDNLQLGSREAQPGQMQLRIEAGVHVKDI